MRTLLRTLTSTVFIAAAAGFVFAHYSGSHRTASLPALNRRVDGRDFSVSYPSSWRVAAQRTVPNLPLAGSVTLTPTGTGRSALVIGTAHPAHPAHPGALPVALRSSLPAAARPQVVTLGGSSFYRYLDLAPTGTGVTESIYVLPTTLGEITAVCTAAQRSDAFTGTCERVLGTVRVTSGRPRTLTVDAGYALELNRILGQLNGTRVTAGPGLRSPDPKVRVAAAAQLAAADDRAAAAAHHITSVTVSLANQPLEAALRMNAAAYRALGTAALRGDVPGYQRAEAQIARSVRALTSVYDQLRGFGYRIG